MIIKLKNQAFYITGRLSRYASQRELERALQAGGATITSDVNLTTTALIVGQGWNTKVQKAAARGLPILDEEQASALIARGFLKLDDAPAPEEIARDAAIGELRPALSGVPSSQAWTDILALLDRCPAEQLDELVDYVDAQTARWDIAPDTRWRLSGPDAAPQGTWNAQQPRGELRLPPFRWLVEMLQGHDSPKYRVLRGLTLLGAGAKVSDVAKLLALPSLANLTSIDLSTTLSATIWKRLYAAPCAATLRELSLGSVLDEHSKAISSGADSALPALSTLRLAVGARSIDQAALQTLWQTPWASRIERLELAGYHYFHREHLTTLTQRAELLPSLRVLSLFIGSSYLSLTDMLPPALRPCETFELSAEMTASHAPNLRLLFTHPLPGFERLDLSRLFIALDFVYEPAIAQDIRDQLSAAMLTALPGSPITTNVQEIKLGRWWSEPLAAALERQGKRVTR